MHRTQIEIYSNLEAYVCHDNKSNFSNKKKNNIFFVKIFRKPVSKCVATTSLTLTLFQKQYP